jgi:hypothetical protein
MHACPRTQIYLHCLQLPAHVHAFLLRTSHVLCCLQLTSHLLACLWMLFARVHMSFYHDREQTWLATTSVNLEEDSLQSQYLMCLYFSVTIMATVGVSCPLCLG